MTENSILRGDDSSGEGRSITRQAMWVEMVVFEAQV